MYYHSASSNRYYKTEDLEEGGQEIMQFSHLLTEAPCNGTVYDSTHSVLDEVSGFSGITLDLNNFPLVFRVLLSPRICILERKSWRKV